MQAGRTTRTKATGLGTRTKMAIALPLAAAAGTHLAVAPAHFREATILGVFFVTTAIVQLAQAFLIGTIPTRRVLASIASVNLVVAGVWVVSRTTGLPFGPDANQPEGIGIIDSLSTAFEIIAAAISIAAMSRASSRGRVIMSRAALFSILTTLFLSTGLANANPNAHGHGHGSLEIGVPGALSGAAADHLHALNVAGEVDPGRAPSRKPSTPLDGAVIHTGKDPVALVAGPGAIWVVNRNDATVSRIATATRAVTTTTVAKQPSAITYGYGFIWVAGYGTDTVQRLDPATGKKVGAPIRVGSGPVAISSGASGIWVATVAEGAVQRIDPRTLRAGKPIPVGYGPTALAVDANGVWVTNTLDRTVVRVDARTLRVSRPIVVPAGNIGIVQGFGKIWVASATAGTVTPIDPRTQKAGTPIRVDNISFPGYGPTAVAILDGRVWVANNHDKTIVSVDPVTGKTGKILFFDNKIASYVGGVQMIANGGSLWVTDFDAGTVVQVSPQTLQGARA